uniref:Uncharacterized protein n=1 Tax=Meloidogyne floridensis TaxID=298350 RepID=A0A915NHL9_9BILA
MSSINILIIFIYFIFVLFQLNSSQQCSKHSEVCNDNDKKCCKALNCKNTKMPNTLFEFTCLYGDCVKEGNTCDYKKGQLCCYGYHCYEGKCVECKLNGSPCNGVVECCSGNVIHTETNKIECAAYDK